MDGLPVVDQVEICADAPKVAGFVEENVRLAVARGVLVRVAFASAGRGVEANAEITLPDGSIESRTFASATRTCRPLARALGAWVSVRMDEWSERKRNEPPEPLVKPTPPSQNPPEGSDDRAAALPPSSGLDATFDVDRDGKRIAEPKGPEVSATSSLVGNLARHTLVGGAVAATVAASDTIVFRASGFGYTAAVNRAFAFGYRMEGCRRVPGRYARFHGMLLDLCAGGEIGILSDARGDSLRGEVFGAFGPSLTIHGDLTRHLALDLGGAFALPVGNSVYRPDPRGLVVAVRGDIGLTWRLP